MLQDIIPSVSTTGGICMPDVFAHITQASPAVLEAIAQTLELRATLPQYQAVLSAYLSDIAFPPHARVLEVGCGTGAAARFIAQWPQVAEVVGTDPSPALVDKARALSAGLATLSFH